MSTAFGFFLRLFLCFAGAKFLLQAIGVGGRGYLIGLTLVFLANVYLFSYLIFKDRTVASAPEASQPTQAPAEAAPKAPAEPE